MTDRAAVVTCFLRHRGEVLLCRRAPGASTYPERWAGISGYVEADDPVGTARTEIREETGIEDPTLLRAGDPFSVQDSDLDREWTVHPFLFEVAERSTRLDAEHTTCEWASPTELLRRETVPELWTSYERVAPTVESIASDRDRGSAALSIDALEVLRDRAGAIAHGVTDGEPAADPEAAIDSDRMNQVRRIAERLLDARPSMVVLRNRVNRVMAEEDTPASIEQAAIAGIERAIEADARAAETAARGVSNQVVFTLSRSGTVLEGLRDGEPDRVIIAESRPHNEGVGVGETLAAADIPTTLCTDAAIAHVVSDGDVDIVLVGADAIGPDGTVVNKTGTRGAALAAAREDVPFLVAAATDKVSPDDELSLETGDPYDVYDGPAAIEVLNPTFDRTPGDLVDGFLTERGRLSTADIGSIADDLPTRRDWPGRQESKSSGE